MNSIPAERQEGMPQVDPASLPDDALILDVRDAADFAAGHAPGAVSMPLSQLVARLTELPIPADGGQLAVSCGGGSKQTRAVAYLRAQGIDAVVLKGGMRGWRGAGRPVTVETSPVQTSPVQTSPVQTSPVQTSPVQTSPAQTTQADPSSD